MGRYNDESAASGSQTQPHEARLLVGDSTQPCKADCGSGHYITADQTACVKCEYGKYSNESNVAECKSDCLAGHYVTSDQDACVQCKPGMYSDLPGLSSCRLCKVGLTSKAAASICDPIETPSEPSDSPDPNSAASSGSASNTRDDGQRSRDSDTTKDGSGSSADAGMVVPSRTGAVDDDDGSVLVPVMVIIVAALAVTVFVLLINRRRAQSSREAPVLFSSTMRRDSKMSVGLALDDVDGDGDGADVEPGRLGGIVPVAQPALPYGTLIASSKSSTPFSGKGPRDGFASVGGQSPSVVLQVTEVVNPTHGLLGMGQNTDVGAASAQGQVERKDRSRNQQKKHVKKKTPPNSVANRTGNRAARRAALMNSMAKH